MTKNCPASLTLKLLTDAVIGKRTVGFGWYAGVAGVFEALSSMAHSHLEFGVASPFLVRLIELCFKHRLHLHFSLLQDHILNRLWIIYEKLCMLLERELLQKVLRKH